MSRSKDIHPDWTLAYRKGKSGRAIARESGVTHQAVYSHLKKHGVPIHPPHVHTNYRELSKAEQRKCVSLYKAGHSMHRTSEVLGITKNRTKSILLSHKIEIRPSPGRVILNNIGEQAYNLRKLGYSWAKIQQILKHRLDLPPGYMLNCAKNYAVRKGLPWPLHTTRFQTFGDAKIRRCIKLYQDEFSIADISQKTKITAHYVAKILRQHKVPIRKQRKLQSAQGKQAYLMRRKGKSWIEIAEQMNRIYVPRTPEQWRHEASKHANANRLPWPVYRSLKIFCTAREKEKYLRLYNAGKSLAWIHKNHKIGLQRLRDLLENEGIRIRNAIQQSSLYGESPIGRLAYDSRRSGMKWDQVAQAVNRRFGGNRTGVSIRSNAKSYAILRGLPWPA